jgi:CubicO group peptidase (beta-lactamase class C family)
MRNRHFAVLAIALSLVTSILAQPARVDDFIKAQMQAQNIPGLSLVVIKSGEIIKAGGYGVADVKRQIPARPDTVYKIASVSKQFIATGIMLLAQEGRLGIGDPISKYLDGTPPTWKDITIRHLLTHTSGLVREAPGFDPNKIQSDAEVIKSAYRLPLRFAPGEKWEYGNLAYFALAEIVRKVSGQPWTAFLDERIFKACGMTATYPTNAEESIPNRARGYVDNNRLLDAPEWPALRASGAFLSTALDLAKWDAALYTDKFLSDSTRREMWTPVTLNDGTLYPYGLGWFVGSLSGRRLVHHSGGMPGFRAAFARFVDDGLTIIVLMNLDDVDRDTIVNGIAAFYLPPRVR